MTKFKSYFFVMAFVFTIIVGAFSRFWKLGSLPGEVHRDEAAIGYNAYSLLLTGRDEHNQPWPVNFRSFGDFKLPGLIYSSIPFIKVLGLNPLSVRISTAIFALATLPVVYWLSRRLGWSKATSLIAMIFISFDFWHISQARNAYEPIAGLFFSSLSWACWLSAERNRNWYLLSLLFYTLGSAFYNLPFLLLPLLIIGSWLIKNYPFHHPTIRFWKIKSFKYVAILLFIVFCLSLFYSGVNVNKTGTAIFSNSDLSNFSQRMTFAGLISGLPSRFVRVINHFGVFSLLKFIHGYLAAFDPTYLFFLGDHNAWHNLRSIALGNSNPVLLIPFSVGIYYLLQQRRKKKSQLTLLYLVLSPVISALTIDSPITNRLLDFHLAMNLIAAIGLIQLFQRFWIKKGKRRIFFLLGVVAYLFLFVIFISRYFFTYNKLLSYSWNPGLSELVEQIKQIDDQYDWIFVTDDLELGYIYFAFYHLFDPDKFQNQAQWYKSGFEQVGEYRQYRFSSFPKWNQITTDNVLSLFDNDHYSILIVERGESDKKMDLVLSQKNWRGEVVWSAWSTNLDEAVSSLKKLPANTERQTVIDYLTLCKQGVCQPDF